MSESKCKQCPVKDGACVVELVPALAGLCEKAREGTWRSHILNRTRIAREGPRPEPARAESPAQPARPCNCGSK